MILDRLDTWRSRCGSTAKPRIPTSLLVWSEVFGWLGMLVTTGAAVFTRRTSLRAMSMVWASIGHSGSMQRTPRASASSVRSTPRPCTLTAKLVELAGAAPGGVLVARCLRARARPGARLTWRTRLPASPSPCSSSAATSRGLWRPSSATTASTSRSSSSTIPRLPMRRACRAGSRRPCCSTTGCPRSRSRGCPSRGSSCPRTTTAGATTSWAPWAPGTATSSRSAS
mmetsp:Transcript_33360/g.95562  ORF Transcript_33360/g.95562 Transcript_33360/m.95562 type:complete len:227 (+) Transcript_33360:377-1057(+)